MRKFFLTFVLALTISSFTFSSAGAAPLVDPLHSQVVPADTTSPGWVSTIDNTCITSQFLNLTPAVKESDTSFSNCSRICPRYCLYAPGVDGSYSDRLNGYCVKISGKYQCEMLTGTENSTSSLQKVNFLGIEVDRAPLVLVRRVMLGVFGAAALIILAYALVATYKYSFSQGQPEKIQEAMKIFKSLVIGTVIVFAGVVLIQIVAMLLGVTGSLTDFNFLPRSGLVVYLYPDDLGKACLVEQTAMTGGQQYYCNNNVWDTNAGVTYVCAGPGNACSSSKPCCTGTCSSANVCP
jgi:hypothetical protein